MRSRTEYSVHNMVIKRGKNTSPPLHKIVSLGSLGNMRLLKMRELWCDFLDFSWIAL
jgi:hypothetical protein